MQMKVLKKLAIHLNWSVCLILLSVPSALSCGKAKPEPREPNPNPPPIDVAIFTGKPENGSIVRAQANEEILCTDPAFKKYRAMTGKDLLLIYSTIGVCLDWGQLTTAQESVLIQALKYDKENYDSL